jgi:hypothetical protein
VIQENGVVPLIVIAANPASVVIPWKGVPTAAFEMV